MDHLFSEFNPSSHEVWLELVQKEVKIPLATYEISEGVQANPFIGNNNGFQLSSFPKSKDGWIIFQAIEGESAIEINKNILEALTGGASGISLSIKDSVFDFETVFREVILSYITVRFYFTDDFFDSVSFFQKLKIFLNGKEATLIFAGLTKGELNAAKDFGSIEIECKKEGSLINNLVDVLRESEQVAFFDDLACSISISGHENFYVNIAQHKIIKILWTKIAEAYQNPTKTIKILTKISQTQTNPNTQVIAATQQTASSVFGGSDAILIEKINFDSDNHSNNFSNRITRNIQNVLWNESFLNRVDDPAAGSYFIDNLCHSMLTEVWNLFIEDK